MIGFWVHTQPMRHDTEAADAFAGSVSFSVPLAMSEVSCLGLGGRLCRGPNQSLENPLGEGSEGLHEWMVALRAWREPHGREGGEVNASNAVVEESRANVGAEIMGRGKFVAAQAGGATIRGEVVG